MTDSVIVRAGRDRSHVWEGKEGRVSQWTGGGGGGREKEMNGQRAGDVRGLRQGTWQQLASNSETQKEADKRRGKERGRTERKGKRNGKRETFGTTGKEKEEIGYKGGKEGQDGGDVQRRGIRFAEICGD